jgi:catechol 2,3-dioxygenase-like lactoylglutathione lyase family enzyme
MEFKLMFCDVTIPTLPSRNFKETLEFYQELGFWECSDPTYFDTEHYLILRRDSIEIHFFYYSKIIPTNAHSGCYIRVSNVAELFEEFSKKNIPHSGIPKIGILDNTDWGMQEFEIIDPNGNLLKFRQQIDS